MYSTGFTRRLSKRMKHLPATLVPTEKEESKEPPLADSAYSSGTDKVSPILETGAEEEKKRPDSMLGPLPSHQARDPSRMRPTHASNENLDIPKANGGLSAPSVRSLASTSKSKTLSIKNIFRKGRKNDKLWSGYE